jgi:ABC-type antimicrobial peptide transport system permease subunit
LLATPGVIEAGSGCCVPTRFSSNLPFNAVGRDIPEGEFTGVVDFAIANPGYFGAFQIPLLRGRDFAAADTGGAPGAVIVNEAVARRFWPDGDALGARILIGGGQMEILGDEPVREIVGIVGDVHNRGLDAEPNPTVYVPQAQLSEAFNAFYMGNVPLVWAVHTAGPPASVARTLEAELREVTGQPVMDTETMSQVVSVATARERFNMLLMSIFGGTAAVLASLGIYGLLAYSVQQRTRELGVRVALGAEPRQIRGIVLREGGALIGLGIAVGLAVALYSAHWLESFLFGVGSRDVVVFVTVPAALALVGVATIGVVAARAGRTDPLEALRHE